MEWGLVSQVVADDGRGGARRWRSPRAWPGGPTFSLGATEGSARTATSTATWADALEDEAAAIELTVRSADFKEGMQRLRREASARRFTGR